MKLFTKYSRINVLATIFIFLVASAAFFFSLRYVLLNQIDQDLNIEEREILDHVQKHDRLPENTSVKDQLINFSPIQSDNIKRKFTTANMIEPGEKEKEKFRQLIFPVKANGQWYQATVSKSLEDTDKLIRSILLISFSTILLILAVSFIINRFVLKRIWRPFYKSLNAVRDFKIGKSEGLQLDDTQIDEFSFMNQTLEKITSQARHDYLSLKTFSENASHEIQTPIAIIRSKLDLLIQDEHLTEEQSKTLQSAYNAIQKLSKLNQSLLLLARIENNQYDESSTVDLKKILEEKISDFNELWHSQKINIRTALQPAMVKMNKELADILLNNLLSNATRHNFTDGNIFIELNQQFLLVRNTSKDAALDRKRIFHRFYKSSQSNEQNGLGLSIIKQICESSGFSTEYDYQDKDHFFKIKWENNSRPIKM
jgi:signal transduction histidine kinase